MYWPWQKKTIPDPELIPITKAEIFELLKPWGITSYELVDRDWVLVPDDYYRAVALASKVRDKQYIPEKRDCDNFAHSLVEAFNKGKGFIFGSCKGRTKSMGPHAWCFYINQDKKVRFVEPQTYGRVDDIISIMSFYTI